MKDWEQFEADVQNKLNLDSTIASGSKFHDPGDAVDNRHPSLTNFPLMVDCKTTINQSFSLKDKMVAEWIKRARTFGKIFALPIRFIDGESDDLVVLRLNDFRDLYLAEENNSAAKVKEDAHNAFIDIVYKIEELCSRSSESSLNNQEVTELLLYAIDKHDSFS